MNIRIHRPGALAKIVGFGLTLATTALAGAALEPASAQSVAQRYVVTNDNRAKSAATAQSYSGNFLLIATHSRFRRGGPFTFCLGLTDNGTVGYPHSGPASVSGAYFGGGTLTGGTFQLIDHLLVATIPVPTGNGQGDAVVFTAPASNGNIGNGVFEQVETSEVDSGVLGAGKKGGC